MSIQSEIERLVGAKNNIAASIENRGVTVPSDTLLSGMPSLIDQITGDVTSVNGQVGDVVLDADDVGALASDVIYVESVNGASGSVVLTAASVGALASDVTYVSSVNGSSGDVVITIPSGASATPQNLGTAAAGSSSDWARADHVHTMPSAGDVGAYVKPNDGIPSSDFTSSVQLSLQKADSALQSAPVTSVNSKTGIVTLTASDVGALASDTTYVVTVNGSSGTVTLTASDVGALASDITYVQSVNGSSGEVTIAIPSKVSDLSNDIGFITGMTILSYGSSTWTDFINAYNANRVVYCRASSNSNPASGAQTRLAFMAYVNDESSPTNVEFQYYRSVSSHSASQQGDQVYVYKLTSAGTWSVTVRESYTKIVAGTNMSSSYSSGALTLSAEIPTVPSGTSEVPLMDGTASVGASTSYARGDHVHPVDTSRASTDIIAVQSAQPSSDTNKLWIDSTSSASAVQLATMDDIPKATVLYYSNVAVASGSGVIATVSSADITVNHIVAQCNFTNPNYITSDIAWTTTTGQVTISGTCNSATTASLILLKSD